MEKKMQGLLLSTSGEFTDDRLNYEIPYGEMFAALMQQEIRTVMEMEAKPGYKHAYLLDATDFVLDHISTVRDRVLKLEADALMQEHIQERRSNAEGKP